MKTFTLHGKEMKVTGKLIKTVRLAEEWYEDIGDPVALLNEIKHSKVKADVFSFWQRLPDFEPRYPYYHEFESIAALRVESYEHWWNHQINAKTRNMVRKAEKKGVEVRLTPFNDDFVSSMKEIFDEAPVRQGKPFWYYGLDVETIKTEFSKDLHRHDIYGAYLQDKLIGFIYLSYAGGYAMTTQIISMIRHRDKATNNALVSKAVEVCAEKNIPYLVYAMWASGSFGSFKKHNGFRRIDLPKYYVPISVKGTFALNFNLHHGFKGLISERMLNYLKSVRTWWYLKGASRVNAR